MDMTKTVQLNGERVKLTEEVNTVSDLLSFYGLRDRIVVVEVNMDIKEKESYQSTMLCDGDKIEIIHFVGGG